MPVELFCSRYVIVLDILPRGRHFETTLGGIRFYTIPPNFARLR